MKAYTMGWYWFKNSFYISYCCVSCFSLTSPLRCHTRFFCVLAINTDVYSLYSYSNEEKKVQLRLPAQLTVEVLKKSAG